VSGAWSFYASTIMVVFGVNVIACWALDLQIGTTGIVNFAFIIFQAAGAYTAGVLTLGPSTGNGGFQHYIGGASVPFPIALLAAGAAGGLLALPIGFLALRRLRSDYQAVVMLVISLIATGVAESQGNLVNGAAGLSLIPQPFQGALHLSSLSYQWFYVGFTGVICLVVYVAVHRLTSSPYGRSLRALRENEHAATALGKNVTRLRLTSFVIGGVMAGISGGVFVGFLGAWAPGSWRYAETFVYISAVIIGGRGNHFGVLLGAFVVPAFGEVSQFVHVFGDPQVAAAIQWIIVAIALLVVLYFWPRGIVPERKRLFAVDGAPSEPGWVRRVRVRRHG
jgi:branched-chain amino acid transport system permease protein